LDGRPEAEFDLLDRFIADYAIDASIAEACMATDSLALARALADFNVPRHEVLRLFSGLTPAKLTQVVNRLNVVEMMMAMQKMRARRTPSNQAHVTNRKEHPLCLRLMQRRPWSAVSPSWKPPLASLATHPSMRWRC
jgi:propanediol dehydratase large subunit